ncbi:hypothetical protein BC938DRAFT_473049 [Jimgerdemannia flammicorona]|uniref:Thioredoxin domain-containing protein n=1 Tax=Jimgerdemannia flammicorona TaxID=994334 RepID=A0A433Q4S7_9FUNG|nr:hypothetical protein BC938DRAFT_473049 [Jimgerdemannia flammicorona]
MEAGIESDLIHTLLYPIPLSEFEPEFRIVASSFQRTSDPSRLIFGHLDFKNGREVYAKLRLTSAPTVLYFPPTEGPNAKIGADTEPKKYDFNRGGFAAEAFADFLVASSGHPVPVTRPTNWLAIGISGFVLVGLAAIIKLIYPHLSVVLRSKNTWAAITLVEILMMTSGHMWNHIRKPPYVVGNGQGGVSYIAQGFQNQIGLESQIVAVIRDPRLFDCLPGRDGSAHRRQDPPALRCLHLDILPRHYVQLPHGSLPNQEPGISVQITDVGMGPWLRFLGDVSKSWLGWIGFRVGCGLFEKFVSCR